MLESIGKFWSIVEDFLKSSFEAIGSLNEGRAEAGEIWIVEVDRLTPIGSARRIGERLDYAWPVFGQGASSVYALYDNQVISIELESGVESLLGDPAPWRKLIGVGPDGQVLGFLADGPFGRPVVLTPSGDLIEGEPPSTAEDQRRHARMAADSRAYTDGRRLVLKASARGRGLDVHLEQGCASSNLSDCGDDFCGQPSLSPDGRYVLWIRAS